MAATASQDARVPTEPEAYRKPKYQPPGKRHQPTRFQSSRSTHPSHKTEQPAETEGHEELSGASMMFGGEPARRADGSLQDSVAWRHELETQHVVPVPIPSPEYLARCGAGYTIDQTPRKLLIILDLNGALVCRAGFHGAKHRDLLPRPGLTRFLSWALAHHHVMVWSSATPKSVQGMLRAAVEEDMQHKLIAVWARDTLGIPPEYYSRKVQTYKNLEIVWNHPDIQKIHKFSQDDTVIIDDSYDKVLQHPHNHIFIPTFDELAAERDNDTALDQIGTYIARLGNVSNVSAYIMQHPLKVYMHGDDGSETTHDATVSAKQVEP